MREVAPTASIVPCDRFGDADGEISVKEITRWFEAQNGHKNGKDLQLEGLIKIFLADDKNEVSTLPPFAMATTMLP
jgi:hypothetical protein